MTTKGDTINLGGTNLRVLSDPVRAHERDAAYWKMRAKVLDGEFTGQELWLVADDKTGPWGTPGAGFV